ncbi:hypothetical protein D8B45_02100 [Candidatus Gracilibacteria bacterium]|nr:MAG: hypothetical protein D8B45_02100 [Candidatus Gracilibacteria bacterium]
MSENTKLLALLDTVIDCYLDKGEPVGSKFLNSLEAVDYAPSTLRKYLNALEKQGMVYQPYNSSGRIPTLQGLSAYLDSRLSECPDDLDLPLNDARKGLKTLVEALGEVSDGVVVGFIRNDEYYYLGINNLLRDDMIDEYSATRTIVRFIEEKKVVAFIDKKILKNQEVYYTFVNDADTLISCVYVKVNLEGYDAVLSIVGPLRVNYKKNISILKKVLESLAS